ncbi:hypothetical protein FG379_001911 [Cryptosporidium bovis]|uniref:uncharacterized protein n=1 Tax=Cryptosporidium bovis TaxID=310047 RepID=UPI00351AAEFC|nr:hypothetical protein FG379_001911 [Cryptosporidium bovis]
MLDDILLSLSGYVGESIEIEPELFKSDSISLYSYKYRLKLKSQLEEYLSLTERGLVSQILQVSSNVYSINEFINNVQSLIYFRDEFSIGDKFDSKNLTSVKEIKKRLLRINPVGFYINAISNCLQEYMIKYLEKISQLEREIFENPGLPLTYILAFTSKPGRVLNVMMEFIDKWYSLSLSVRNDSTSRFSFSNMFILMEKNDNICDIYISVPCGYILDYFYIGINSGDPLKEAVYRNLLLVCNRVLSYQIINWIMIGRLVDPFEEFIVGRFSVAIDSSKFYKPEISSNNSFIPIDSCFEAYIDENILELHDSEESIHCFIFEWEGLFYTRYESFTQKYLLPKLLYTIFSAGKTLRIIKRFGYKDKKFESKLEYYLEKFNQLFDSSFPYIQTPLEELVNEYRKYLSLIMFETLKNNNNNITSIFKLIRELYLLGNGDLFSQFDNNIFKFSINSEKNNVNISEQFEYVKSIWNDLIVFNDKLGKTKNQNTMKGILEIKLNFCSDTFDLFNFGIDEEDLVVTFNCDINSELFTLKLNDKNDCDTIYNNHESVINDKNKDIDFETDINNDGLGIVSYCRTKWPIRIIDGFNHVIECISSPNVVSSLLLTASENGIPFKINGYNTNKHYLETENNREFIRFMWFIDIKNDNSIEFNIKVYWHTTNLKPLLNTDKNYSLLKTNIIKLVNIEDNNSMSNLFSYRIRILFKQSNISFYLEPYKYTSINTISILHKPTQILNIKHINLDICLPLISSSCYFYLIRHSSIKKQNERLLKLLITKWCHISATGNVDVVSQFYYSSNNSSISYLDFSSSFSKDNNSNNYYNILVNKHLNKFISGIHFNNHIFRLRLVEKLSWPFPLIFTKKNMEHYYNLFDFYWLFFKTYNGLERLWTEMFNIRYGYRRNTYCLFLREYYVNNFWNYISYCRWVLQITIGEFYSFLQDFAINESYSIFFENIGNEGDFENILLRHSELIQNLVLKSGFLLSSILNPLTTIFILTNEWTYSVYSEISRWNDISDKNDTYKERNYSLLSSNNINILDDYPWNNYEWKNLTEITVKFMKNFILLWDNLCSEMSIISNNIQYQHFSYLLSIFNNNRWNIDIPEINNVNIELNDKNLYYADSYSSSENDQVEGKYTINSFYDSNTEDDDFDYINYYDEDNFEYEKEQDSDLYEIRNNDLFIDDSVKTLNYSIKQKYITVNENEYFGNSNCKYESKEYISGEF